MMDKCLSVAVITALFSCRVPPYYNLATGLFTATGSMTDSREGQTATLLNNGQVLIAGGDHSATLASAELYLPGTLTPTGLVSITLTPATPTLSVGSTQQFVATGTFIDGSMQKLQSVTWSSSNQSVSTITNDASDHGVIQVSGGDLQNYGERRVCERLDRSDSAAKIRGAGRET